MSLRLEKRIEKLEKEVAKLKRELKEEREKRDARDEGLLLKAAEKVMATYLETQVEFSMSTEGQIKELMEANG